MIFIAKLLRLAKGDCCAVRPPLVCRLQPARVPPVAAASVSAERVLPLPRAQTLDVLESAFKVNLACPPGLFGGMLSCWSVRGSWERGRGANVTAGVCHDAVWVWGDRWAACAVPEPPA